MKTSAPLRHAVRLGLLAAAIQSAYAAEPVLDTVVVKGLRDDVPTLASRSAPSASLKATQPQSIISRAYIEDSVAPTGDYTNIIGIAPSVGGSVAANGPGLGESKLTLRGFQDGEYNVTFDGIPFADTNNPTHHSNAYFPATVIGGASVERGPGTASNLGQATFGGSVNLVSRELMETTTFSPFASYGSWNTRLIGAEVNTGVLKESHDLAASIQVSHVETNGRQTWSGFGGDNVTFKAQLPLVPGTTLTLFAARSDEKYNAPDKAGVTQEQVALFGKSYSLNADPKSQNYWGYNNVRKRTDFDYLGLVSDLGNGFALDNKLYTYAYNNQTLSGQDASGATANGTKAGATGNTDVPGYSKLNAYRVFGDILVLGKTFAAGTARTGLWWEHASTLRNTRDLDWTLGGIPNPKESSAPKDIAYDQDSGWKQVQPFAEFEWRATEALTVTPGYKYVHFERSIDARVNQTTRTPLEYSHTYTTTLPFLTANYRLAREWSVYAQTARGMLVPDLSYFYVNNPSRSSIDPQTSRNLQLGVVHKSERFAFDADLYRISFSNKIASTGTGNDLVYYNQGGVTYKGAEAQLTYYAGSGFSLHGNGSVNRAEANDSGLQVAKAPSMTAASGVFYGDGVWNGSLVGKRVGSQFAKDGEPAAYRIAAYNTVDLAAGRVLVDVPGLRNAKVQLGVYNLFNGQSATAISASSKGARFDQYSYQPGRNFMLSLKADI
ncbi:TonB-dependent receptor [Derxia lacustris]|uniref:TonB-dependent receptor n=1 Tax=Derxia lacustris TaxID=764842 RepID=UPI000A1711E7|nr:TonB-dependent receptor [Derxia lacustris]